MLALGPGGCEVRERGEGPGGHRRVLPRERPGRGPWMPRLRAGLRAAGGLPVRPVRPRLPCPAWGPLCDSVSSSIKGTEAPSTAHPHRAPHLSDGPTEPRPFCTVGCPKEGSVCWGRGSARSGLQGSVLTGAGERGAGKAGQDCSSVHTQRPELLARETSLHGLRKLGVLRAGPLAVDTEIWGPCCCPQSRKTGVGESPGHSQAWVQILASFLPTVHPRRNDPAPRPAFPRLQG